jgi:hypothetical protein
MVEARIKAGAATLLVLIALAVAVIAPASAMAAASTFAGGPDQAPAYVLNDHTPVAVHFTASGLATSTTYYVKVRYTVGTSPSGLTNRGYTWNAASKAWVQERDDWTTFPTVTTSASGAITNNAGWVFSKFGDDALAGQYHVMVSLSATGNASTFNSSITPTVTVLDPRTNGSWVHNGVATGKVASTRAAVTDAASSTTLSLQKTEAQGVDDDANGIVDDEDWGPAGATGDFHLGIPSVTALGINLNQTTWIPGNGFISGPADTDLAISAADTVAPSAAGSFSASSHDASASLSWDAATDNADIAGYYVYRWTPVPLGSAYSAVHSRIATLGAGTTAYDDSGLTNGATYLYEVRAFDAAGNVGPRSATGTATPVTAVPTAVVSPAVPDGSNGWYLDSPTVTLTSPGGWTILYSLEASPSTWTTYTVPVVIPNGLTKITFRDTDGVTLSATDSIDFKVDTTEPVATISSPAMSVLASKNRTFNVSWMGADTGSGIDSYDVEYKTSAAGAWTPLRLATQSTSLAFTTDAGANVSFRVRAYDVAGNTGDWSPIATTVVPFDQTKASASSGWKTVKNSNYYLGSARTTTKKGAYTALSFTQGTLYLVTRTGPSMGKLAVYYRGKKVGTVDLHSSKIKYRQSIKILSVPSSAKAYPVKLVNLGVKGHKQVEIDGFSIQR